MAGWITIAKNELRKYTSKFRKNRTLFWIIIISVVIAITILIPVIVHAIADPLIQQALADFGLPISIPLDASIVAIIMPYVMPVFQLSMLMMFFMLILYPVQNALQELNIGHLELVLSAPVRARDVLFGEFVGQIPIIAIGVSIISSVFISIISLAIQITVVVAIFFILIILATFLTATWLGTMLSAWLSMKFGFSEQGKDKAKGFMMVFSVILIVPILFLEFIPFYFPQVLTDPMFRAVFQFIPTSWIADSIFILILSSAGISFVGVFPIFNTFTIPILLSAFFFLTFYLGYSNLDKIYNFESETQSTTVTVIKENAFYRFTKNRLGPFFTVQLKDFFRRRENISRLAYAVAMAIFLPVIMMVTMGTTGEVREFLNLGFWIFMTGLMFSLMLGSMLGSTIMLRSKDMIWIYKKSPKGSTALATSFFWAIAFIAMILSIPITIIDALIIQLTFLEWIILFIFINIYTIGALLVSIGIQSLNPTYKEKGGKMTLNVLLTMGILLGSVIFGILFSMLFVRIGWSYDLGFFMIPIMSFLLSLPIFYAGIRHLDNLE